MVGQLGQMGIQFGAQGLMLKYSRGDESQADAVGAMILYKAGYNPQALADFFKTLETQGSKAPPQFLSDHPNPSNREQAIDKEIKDWPPQQYAGDSPSFQEVRRHAMGVKAFTAEEIAQGAKSGEWATLNKKNGATFNPAGASLVSTSTAAPGSSPKAEAASLESVLPSQRMRTADLGPLKIEYPENWQVTPPKQQGQFVTIAPQAGISANGVGYGVLLNGIAPAKGEPMSIDDVTSQLVKDMEQNEALQPLGNAKAISVAGVQGRSIMLQSVSPFPAANGQSQKEHDWLVTIPQNGGAVIFMVFVAPQSQFERFRPTYEAMLKSVKF